MNNYPKEVDEKNIITINIPNDKEIKEWSELVLCKYNTNFIYEYKSELERAIELYGRIPRHIYFHFLYLDMGESYWKFIKNY